MVQQSVGEEIYDCSRARKRTNLHFKQNTVIWEVHNK